MIRKLSAVAAGVGALLVSSAAHAQAAPSSFGNQGQFIFSADRLFPVFGYSRGSLNEPGQPPAGVNKVVDSEDQTALGFFWGATPAFQGVGTAGVAIPNVYTVPRLGFDYTIIPNVTIGGDVTVFFTLGGSGSSETYESNGNTQTTTGPEPKSTIFGIAPRAGYILHLTDLLSLWLRGGVSFYTATSKTSNTNNGQTTTNSFNFDQLGLDLDPQLVITPIPHFGFTVGVTGDIPLTGGISESTTVSGGGSTSVSSHASLLFVGVTGGLVGWF
jgi:hypothetical protein